MRRSTPQIKKSPKTQNMAIFCSLASQMVIFLIFLGQSSGPQYVFTRWTGTLNILYDEKFRPKISRAGTYLYS